MLNRFTLAKQLQETELRDVKKPGRLLTALHFLKLCASGRA
jgi:hypothetical protein